MRFYQGEKMVDGSNGSMCNNGEREICEYI